LKLGFQPRRLDPSCAVETNGHTLTFNDHGHLAGTVGMFQHDIELVRVRNNIMIFYSFAFLLECFTSSVGVRSGTLSKN
jgi:hypothetical protein